MLPALVPLSVLVGQVVGHEARTATSASAPAPDKVGSVLPVDTPAEARGRRILSTAFVRVGPGGYVSVELRSGRVLALRGVVMRRRDYCGLDVSGASPDRRYCGGYHEIAAARPAGGPGPVHPVPVIADSFARAAEPK